MNNEKSYYLVRSSRDIPWDKSVIGVGWDDIPFCEHDDCKTLIEAIDGNYGIGRSANQVRRFKSIKPGDVIVVPTWGAVVIGIAEEEELHDPTFQYKWGSNQHRVKFFTDANGQVLFVPRDELSNRLQTRCRIRLTIADVGEFAGELDQITNRLSEGKKYSWDAELASRAELMEKTAKSQLLSNIQNGHNTILKAGGIGLELLVTDLLAADGFTARVLSKRTFAGMGDADVSASKDNFLGETESYLVQVKHHTGNTSAWALSQLATIQDDLPEEYTDHRMVLLTTGQVDGDVEKEARQKKIAIVTGEQLVDWVFNNLQALSLKTRNALGLIEVPQLLQ